MTERLSKYAPIILLAAAVIFGQTASIETSAEPTTITIGDRVTYRVIITHDPEIDIAWPGAAAELGQFQIIDYDISDIDTLADGRVSETITYYISTYDTGDWIIPPTAIAYIDRSDSTRFLRTESIKITVKSLISDDDWAKIKAFAESDTTYAGMEKQIAAGLALKMAKEELLRDINDVYKLKRGLRFWIGIAVVLLVLTGLVIGFVFWRNGRGKIGAIFSFTAPKVPPHEGALMELTALLASQYIARGKFKEYYSRLSEILREYIEKRIGILALELSTTETMANLSSANFPLTGEQLELIESTLDRSDMVKFAKLIPPDNWHVETVEMAKQFVESTRPEEPEIDEETEESTETTESFTESVSDKPEETV